MREFLNTLNSIEPGDIIGFSGRSFTSDAVNLLSFGLPRWGLSHVGICSHHDTRYELQLYDSASGFGVRNQHLFQGIRKYGGRAWLYKLQRPLYTHELSRLAGHTQKDLGKEYDTAGALQAGGKLWAALQGVARGEDLTTFFCSEFVAEQLSYIGVFNTSNASRWNPNHLMRTLRRLGIVQPPVRIK